MKMLEKFLIMLNYEYIYKMKTKIRNFFYYFINCILFFNYEVFCRLTAISNRRSYTNRSINFNILHLSTKIKLCLVNINTLLNIKKEYN